MQSSSPYMSYNGSQYRYFHVSDAAQRNSKLFHTETPGTMQVTVEPLTGDAMNGDAQRDKMPADTKMADHFICIEYDPIQKPDEQCSYSRAQRQVAQSALPSLLVDRCKENEKQGLRVMSSFDSTSIFGEEKAFEWLNDWVVNLVNSLDPSTETSVAVLRYIDQVSYSIPLTSLNFQFLFLTALILSYKNFESRQDSQMLYKFNIRCYDKERSKEIKNKMFALEIELLGALRWDLIPSKQEMKVYKLELDKRDREIIEQLSPL